MTAEFAVNNKTHSATKVSPFIVNYGRELKIGADIRKKGKLEKVIEFAARMKKVQEKVEVALRKAQKEIKIKANRERMEVEEWKKDNKVMLSTKDLVFKERPAMKLEDWYVGLYITDEVVSTNTVKLQLPTLMRIHLVVNVSQVVWYREQVECQNWKQGTWFLFYFILFSLMFYCWS